MMAKRSFHDIVVYLDDFLVGGAALEECECGYTTPSRLLQNLELTINQHKLVPPTQQLVLCSIQLDTIACSMTLPQEKLLDLQVLVSSFQSKDHATTASGQTQLGVQGC